MIKITRISVQKKNKERYNLYIDQGNGEEYGFSVDQDVLIKQNLKKGMSLDVENLKAVIEEDEVKKAYHLAIHYLSYRMRSIAEVRMYLQKKEKQSSQIEKVIQKLLEQKLLDDQAFAEAYVRSKIHTQLKGPNRLEQELQHKGVEKSIAEQAVRLFPEDDQIDSVANWLSKQLNKRKRESAIAIKQKLTNQLVNKGFKHSVITQAFALSEEEQETVSEAEWEALSYQASKLERKYGKQFEGFQYEQKMKQGLYRKGFSFELIEKYMANNSGE